MTGLPPELLKHAYPLFVGVDRISKRKLDKRRSRFQKSRRVPTPHRRSLSDNHSSPRAGVGIGVMMPLRIGDRNKIVLAATTVPLQIYNKVQFNAFYIKLFESERALLTAQTPHPN